MKKGHIFLILFISSTILHTCYQDYKLQKNHHVTCATITSIMYAPRTRGISYYFYVNGEKISTYKPLSRNNFNTSVSSYINKQFPVAYEEGNPQNSEIILNRDVMAIYNLSIADWCKCTDTTWLKPWDRFYGDNPPW